MLFSRGVGEETDIVNKEMYTFEDRDGSSLTLRPENTASVIRSYIENRLDQQPGVQKLYYIGPMFRRERPQKGRYRQFYQIGAEAIGSESPAIDAEVIELVVAILQEVGIDDFELLINSVGSKESRVRYNEALQEELKDVAPKMCEDCRRRAQTNPLRVLDCKVPEDQPIIDRLPSILDFLDDDDREHFRRVREFLEDRQIQFHRKPAVGARTRLLRPHHVRNHSWSFGFPERNLGWRPIRQVSRNTGSKTPRRVSVFPSAKIGW